MIRKNISKKTILIIFLYIDFNFLNGINFLLLKKCSVIYVEKSLVYYMKNKERTNRILLHVFCLCFLYDKFYEFQVTNIS